MWLHTSITVKETQMVKWTIFLEIIKTTLHEVKLKISPSLSVKSKTI